jgi:hypothetical protein
MNKKILLALLLLCSWQAGLAAAAVPGTDLAAFEKAKLLIFDKQWAAALTQLAEVIDRHPESRYYATALFYRGKCQEELGAKKQALGSYEKFVADAGESNLAEEARISIVDLAAELVQGGEKDLLPKMLDLLGNENKVVSYYAAFKLSYLPDRAIAARALPVLQTILDNEKDEELRDRAKIAVMRIDPARLKAMDRQNKGWAGQMLKILILDRRNRKEKVSLSIPLALADLALNALSNEQKRALQKKGYDLDGIMDQLTAKGMKIDIHEEDEVIQIWVE